MTVGTTTAPSEALVAAVDGLIRLALTIAGTKLRHSPRCRRSERAWAYHVDPATMHTRIGVSLSDAEYLLDGVWTHVPEIARRHGVDPDCLTTELNDFARELIAAGVEYRYDDVPAVLRRATCLTATNGGTADA